MSRLCHPEQEQEQEQGQHHQKELESGVEVLLLGVAQDGGFPQFGCSCPQCARVFSGELEGDSAVSLAVIDHTTQQYWLFDASMQLSEQWRRFGGLLSRYTLAGIFLTHAHVGHYLGLPYVGKECHNSRGLPLYASAPMHAFLQTNQPFGVLYTNNNVEEVVLAGEQVMMLTPRLTVTAHAVQHRADFTDTFAFTISGPTRRLFFCPDIDSWAGLAPLYSLPMLLASRELLLLDATFYDNQELPGAGAGRDMTTIPHPRVVTTLQIVRDEVRRHEHEHKKNISTTTEAAAAAVTCTTAPAASSAVEGRLGEVVLIHLNHSNRLWHHDHEDKDLSALSGYASVGRTGQTWFL